MFFLRRHSLQEKRSICTMKPGVFNLICPCVLNSAGNCLTIAFNSNHATDTLRSNQPNGPNAAVSIQNGLRFIWICHLNCCPVENLCLFRVDLVKAGRRQPKANPAKAVFNPPFSIEHFLRRTENGAGIPWINILNDAAYLLGKEPEDGLQRP